MLRHRGTCDGDRAFQSLKNDTGVPYAFFVSGRLTAARQETLATSFFSFCLVVRPLFTQLKGIAHQINQRKIRHLFLKLFKYNKQETGGSVSCLYSINYWAVYSLYLLNTRKSE